MIDRLRARLCTFCAGRLLDGRRAGSGFELQSRHVRLPCGQCGEPTYFRPVKQWIGREQPTEPAYTADPEEHDQP